MDITEQLSENGWKLSPEGYNILTEDGKITDLAIIEKKALDNDLREIGGCAFPPEMNKGKYESVTGNMVVQIQKTRNISEPKANEESRHAPRMFKLILTDGTQSCTALEMSPLVDISFNTPPGTKLRLKGEMIISHGLLLLHTENVEVLGGRVIALVEKWLTNKNLVKQARGRVGAEGGPPPWIPFGEKLTTSIADKNFKSLDDGSKDGRDNEEFEAQRRDAIAEAGKAAGCTKKVFGGGTKPLLDRNIQAIMSKGFTIQEAEAALKQSKNNVDRALKNLQRKTGKGSDDKEKTEKEVGGRERGGRRKGGDEETGPKPSGRVSLFDFLEDKLPSLPDKDKTKEREKEWEAPKHNFEQNNKSKGYPGQEKNKNRERGTQNNHIMGNGMEKKKEDKQPRWQNHTQNQKPPRFQNQTRRTEINNDPFDHFSNRNDQQAGRQVDNYFGSKPSQPQYNGYRNNYKSDNIGYNMNSGGDFRNQNSNYFKPAGMPDIPEFPYKDSAFIPPLLPTSNQFMNSPKNNVSQNSTPKTESGGKYRWKVGDKCMAKYWEDNMYYDAEVTGISKKTCVVRFLEYGNFEEVLQDDCLPVSEEPIENINLPNNEQQGYNNNRNNHFSGSIEFRRGGTRPYIKPESAAGRKPRYSQPVYMPPASRREAK